MQERMKIFKIITVSLVIFIALLSCAMVINFVKLAKANSRQKLLEAELASKQAQYEAGEKEITTKQSKEYITRYARLYLDMKGKDEKVYKSDINDSAETRGE